MAKRVRVQCINKTDRSSAHERIRNIGGTNTNGTRWRLTETEAIKATEDGTYSFYVERPAGHVVDVVVAQRLGHKYLKTTTDGEQPDNLLALPDCPA
jgi:hypothetical protein